MELLNPEVHIRYIVAFNVVVSSELEETSCRPGVSLAATPVSYG